MANMTNCSDLHSKKDFEDLMFRILNPLKPLYSPGCAGLILGDTFAHYDLGATRMEAVSRPLWALVPFWAGGGKEDAEVTFAEIYRKALASGTDPKGEEFWGDCTSFDQRFVEMAAISYGIMYAPNVVWDPLSEQEKDNLAKYLSQINDHPLPVCNWILFAVLVNIALKKVGRPYSSEMLNRYLDGLEQFYLGDGWYCDGDSGQKDYYISFAIQFYTLIYAHVCAEEDADRAAKYRTRAMEFAQSFVYWFDDEGGAIPFGRSLTYRFAQVSFFSVCLLTNVNPFPLAVMKGLIARHLQWWMNRSIFDRDGILTIGYGYSNLTMGERYNAPGSPYWAMKTFAFMALPDDHPFWTVKAEDYPRELIEKPLCPIPMADMLMYHYGNRTAAFAPGVYSKNGHGHIVEKYSKFVYDTKFSISVARSQYELCECAPDNMLAFVIHDYVYVRRQCISSSIEKDRVISKWSPYPGIVVETQIIPDAEGHKRIHTISSCIECEAYDYGFAIQRDDFVVTEFDEQNAENSSRVSNKHSFCEVICEHTDGATCLGGDYLRADPDTNLLYQRTTIPGVKFKIHVGSQVIEDRVKARWL